MHLRQSTRIPKPVAECALALPQAVAEVAGEEPRVGFTIGPAPVRKRVRLSIGGPETVGQWLRIPVSWSARPGASFFPVLDGYMQLEPVSARESRLSLRANYQPPLGRLGKAVDDVAMHNVARATVKDFLDAVRARVLEEA
jgi:hypothetical protein